MDTLRTVFDIPGSRLKLDYETFSLWLGSCFTENIGSRLKDLKFPAEVNPFGVLYNPVSIKNSIDILIERRIFTESDLNFGNGLWFSFSHHSSFSHADRDTCLKYINESIDRSSRVLEKAASIFITFGTARVYRLRETSATVSNCHKLPHGRFNHMLLGVDEIVNLFIPLINRLKSFNSRLRIVFTVSPVRHWKDGATGNQVSKSTLILAVSKLVEVFDNVGYFPAYEIVMDDLRDYRFYEKDMLHINDQGVDYIWERFVKSFIDADAQSLMKDVAKIMQGMRHRPFNPHSREYRNFLQNLLGEISKIENCCKLIGFSSERAEILSGIENPEDN